MSKGVEIIIQQALLKKLDFCVFSIYFNFVLSNKDFIIMSTQLKKQAFSALNSSVQAWWRWQDLPRLSFAV